MKKTLILLALGAFVGVLIWLNIERFFGSKSLPVFDKDGAVLPPVSTQTMPTDIKRNPTRAAASELEKVVVNIDTVGRPVSVPDWGFFGMGYRYVQPQGSGSGVIIRPDGFIVTNNHVIDNAQTILVTLNTGERIRGEIWGKDQTTDLAVVKINRKDLPYARFGNSNEIRVGDPVIAVGNALGLGTTVTSGIISALERRVGGTENKALERAIQTDAAINRGNSGGALALMNGDVIGINTAIFSTEPGGGNIGIGFAIPSNTVRSVVSELIKNRKIERPAPAWVGIEYWPNTPEVAQELQQQIGVQYPTSTDGIIVRNVVNGSPASTAGVKQLDNILKVDGQLIRGQEAFAKIIRAKKPGDVVKLTVYRPALGKELTISVTLAAFPQEMMRTKQPAREAPLRGFQFPF